MSETSTEVLASVLFVAFGLLMMIIAYKFKKIFHVPVSTTLIIFGILLRIIGPYIGQLANVVDLIVNLNEEAITLGFLPILIFSASISVDWHTVKKEIFQIIPLSTSVVACCTILTAAVLKYIFLYSYSWEQLLLLGVILSATDHIAVDSLLKDIYASDTLETLIGGETMFNEATVFVLFNVFLKTSYDLSGSIGLFFRLSFGGFGLGIGLGFIMGFLLKRLLNDFYKETCLLLVGAYLLFWLCEWSTIHVSGALALVSYGLYISAYGKTLISPSVEERLKEFLEGLSVEVESLVFIIAGLLFGDVSIYNNTLLTKSDYYGMFILFPITYLIRALVLLIHYPLLKYSGYGINWKEMVALCFCGMKGVISTSLALVIYHKDSIVDDRFKILAVYFGIGIAALSMVIGGTITRVLIKHLGLEDLTDVQENMLISVTTALIEISEKKIEDIRNENELKLIKWDEVDSICGANILINSILKTSKTGLEVLNDNNDRDYKILIDKFSKRFNLNRKALAIEMRRRYLSTLKGIYWSRFEKGLCHGDTSLLLIDSCSMCLDSDEMPMRDWEIVRSMLSSDKAIKVLSKLSNCPIIGNIFRKKIYKMIILAYDSANNFIKCHEETEKLIDEMEIDIDKLVFEDVMKESHAQVLLCEDYLKTYIIDCYPEVLSEVQTKRCTKVLLYYQRELIETLYEDGVLQELEYFSLISSIDSSVKIATFQGIPAMPLLKDILTNRFVAASSHEIHTLIKGIYEKKYNAGENIFTEGHEANGAFLIIRGRVKEKSSWIDQELTIGNIVGIQHLLQEFSQYYTSTATSITSVVVAHIPKGIIDLEGFTEDLYDEARQEIVLLNREKYGLSDVNEKLILRFLDASRVVVHKQGKKVVFVDGALQLKGKSYEKQTKLFIRPSNKQREIFENSILLILPTDFGLDYRKEYSLSEALKKFYVKISNENQFVKSEDLDDNDAINESKVDRTGLIKNYSINLSKFKSVVPRN